LKPYLLSFRTIDISHVNTALELPAVPPAVSTLDAIEAQTAIMGSVDEALNFLIIQCGPADFHQAYFEILKFLAPNVKTVRTEARADFYATTIGEDEYVTHFGSRLHTKALLHNSTLKPGGSHIQLEDVSATLINGIKGRSRYDKARGLLMSQPDIGYQATIDTLARNSDESACHADAAHTTPNLTANAVQEQGRSGGRGGRGGRGGGKGGKGGRPPTTPTPLGQGWKLSTTTSSTDDRSDRPCISTFLNGPDGKCPRLEKGEQCPYNHNFTVSQKPQTHANTVDTTLYQPRREAQTQYEQFLLFQQQTEQKIPIATHTPPTQTQLQLQSFSAQAPTGTGASQAPASGYSSSVFPTYDPRVSIHDNGFHYQALHVQAQTQKMPKAHQKMPKAHQKMPKAHKKMPKAHQKMPKAHQKMPKAHQKMPKAHQKTNATEANCSVYLFSLLFSVLLCASSSLACILLFPFTMLCSKLNGDIHNPNFFKYASAPQRVLFAPDPVSTFNAVVNFVFLPCDLIFGSLFCLARAAPNLITKSPTKAPTKGPTKAPTKAPTTSPTKAPTKSPTTASPTTSPSTTTAIVITPPPP
jgi:hypothetical protein